MAKQIKYLTFSDIIGVLESVKEEDMLLDDPDIKEDLIYIRDDRAVRKVLDKAIWGLPYRGKPTIFDSAAIYLRDFALEHLFSNGNKRCAFTAASLFLEKNGIELVFEGDMDAHDFVRYEIVAKKELKGIEVTHEEVKEWLEDHAFYLSTGKPFKKRNVQYCAERRKV